MKLSDAMEAGALLIPRANNAAFYFATLDGDGNEAWWNPTSGLPRLACPLGQALVGAAGTVEGVAALCRKTLGAGLSTAFTTTLLVTFPLLREKVGKNPPCPCTYQTPTMLMLWLVAHLVDRHKWTTAEIAAYIRDREAGRRAR